MATTIAEDMMKLTEEIVAANDARLRTVDTLVMGTRATLKGFRAGRSEMATNQAKDLADFTGQLSRDVDEIRRKAQGLIKEFDTTNRRMGKEQSKRLAGFVRGLTRDVTSMLRRFDKERGSLSRELGERLAQEIAEIKAAVEQIVNEAGNFMNEQRAGMAQARQAWRNMSAAINKGPKAGLPMPTAAVGHEACTAKHATPRTRAKKCAARTKR